MSTKHTPGPWRVQTSKPDHTSRIKGIDGVDVTIAEIRSYADGGTLERQEANARLIASAPELLQAAQKVLADLNERIKYASPHAVPVINGIADLHAAIAKATGGTE